MKKYLQICHTIEQCRILNERSLFTHLWSQFYVWKPLKCREEKLGKAGVKYTPAFVRLHA